MGRFEGRRYVQTHVNVVYLLMELRISGLAVDKYRQAAFMTTPQLQSLESYSQALTAAINK
jgi:hypothetical protein